MVSQILYERHCMKCDHVTCLLIRAITQYAMQILNSVDLRLSQIPQI